LFAAVAAASPFRDRVWDCGTGTGQAAHGLAAHFDSVIASDASREQVRAASPHGRVRYFVARAEAVPLRSRSVGMVTVAQALHWLELPEFYAEARRVLRPGGLLVVWTYGRQRVDRGHVDQVLADFYDRVIGSHWAPERRWVETGYRTLWFPFEEIALDAPPMYAEWSLPQLLGYIGTWSAVAKCREVTGTDPLTGLVGRLIPLWGDPSSPRGVEWPISVRAGR
jgi:SAM-dependent methyltransferase